MTARNSQEFARKSPKSAHSRSWDAGRTAFKMIAQHKTSADPKSYAVWYEYTSKKNPDLVLALDEIVAENRGVSDAEMRHLHENYIAEKRETEAKLQNISREIESKVAGAQSLVTEAISNASDYASSMDKAKDRLPSASSPEDIIDALDEIIEQTQTSQESAQNIQLALQSKHEEITQLNEKVTQLRENLNLDPLTALINREKFETIIAESSAAALANGYSMTVMVVQIKNLSDLSFTAGMDISEFVVKTLAGFLTKSVGESGVCARLDGSVLAVMLPKSAYADASKIAKAVIEELDHFKIVKKPADELIGYIRCAFGGSSFKPGLKPNDLLRIAASQASATKFANKSHVKFDLTNHQAA